MRTRLLMLLNVLLMLVVLGAVPLEAASTTDVTEMFKYTYGAERLLYMFIQQYVAYRILNRKKKQVGGRGQWILPIQTRNAGVWMGHAEGGAKTTRRAQPDTAEATFSLQEFHGIWDISWKMLQDARKDEYSFARAIDFMDSSMNRRVFRLFDCDLIGDGLGRLATLPAADNQVTITVAELPMVDLGMIVDLMDESDHNTIVGPDGAAVTAIDVKNRTITTGTAGSGTAAGDYFTVADTVTSATSLHTVGLLAWADDANPATPVGNLGGLNRSTTGNDYWQGNVLDNSGTNRPASDDLFLQLLDLIRERGGVPVTDWMSNYAIIRRYHESLQDDVFYSMGRVREFEGAVGRGRNEEAFQGGEESEGETPYRFSGIPWRAEPFFRANRILGLNRDHVFVGYGENEVPQPLSEIFDDLVPFFTSTSNTTFEVVSYGQYEELCDNPGALGVIEDVAES